MDYCVVELVADVDDNVLDIIDRIDEIEDEQRARLPKRYVACGAHLKIVDIVARRPGSFHDASIFGASSLKSRFE
uniref:Uncharacterized protein n=1 Tax=Timema monikensis TaxID=170555 RepID=A0A7R9HTK9_9NEOP|nr:unnamed protein product [Timema monikensis]